MTSPAKRLRRIRVTHTFSDGRVGAASVREAYRGEQPETSREWTAFFHRLQTYLSNLSKLQRRMPAEQFRAFLRAYSQHWLTSLEYGERATEPQRFFKEWAQIQGLGQIAMDTDRSIYGSRNYDIARRKLKL
jgi:hypothetical protein